jgi:hypothetical protein
MHKDLIAACQMFLVPMTILFAAIALARTEQLKTLISVMGGLTAVAWLIAILRWPDLSWSQTWPTIFLAAVFVAAWAISTIAHFLNWKKLGLFSTEEPPAQQVIVTMKQE